MSSKVASLVVSLLAIAEGHSTDTEALREANTDEVLNLISPELLDRVAYQLYAEDDEHLSQYERLLHNDKRTKMDYLNNAQTDDHVERDHGQNQNRHYSRRSQDQSRERRMADFEAETEARQREYEDEMRDRQARFEAEFDEPSDWMPYQDHEQPNRGGPSKKRSKNKKRQRMTREEGEAAAKEYREAEISKAIKERDRLKQDMTRKEKEDRDKAMADKRDDERKEKEEMQKMEEERRKNRRDKRKRRREDRAKRREEVERARNDAEKALEKEEKEAEKANPIPLTNEDDVDNTVDDDAQKANSIPSLHLVPRVTRGMMLEYSEHSEGMTLFQLAQHQTEVETENIDPRDYSVESSIEEEPQVEDDFFEPAIQPEQMYYGDEEEHQRHQLAQLPEEREFVEYMPPIINKDVHEVDGAHDTQSDLSSASIYSEGFSNTRSSVSQSQTSSSSSARSSSRSSSVSSSSSSGTSRDWVSTSSGYQGLEEAQSLAIQRLQRDRDLRRRRAFLKEQADIAHMEEEKRRRALSVTSSSQSSSSTERHEIVVPEPRSEDERVYHHERQYSHSDQGDSQSMHEFQDEFTAEVAAAHSDDEVYHAKYEQLQHDMEYFTHEAEKVKEEAIRDADEAHQRAASAERKAHEAEDKAYEMEKQAKDAEKRVKRLQEQAHQAEEKFRMIQHDWEEVKEMSHQKETYLVDAEQQFEEELYHHQRTWSSERSSSSSHYDSINSNEQEYSEPEPIQLLMKHDGKRHERILNERRSKLTPQEEQQQPKKAQPERLAAPKSQRAPRQSQQQPPQQKSQQQQPQMKSQQQPQMRTQQQPQMRSQQKPQMRSQQQPPQIQSQQQQPKMKSQQQQPQMKTQQKPHMKTQQQPPRIQSQQQQPQMKTQQKSPQLKSHQKEQDSPTPQIVMKPYKPQQSKAEDWEMPESKQQKQQAPKPSLEKPRKTLQEPKPTKQARKKQSQFEQTSKPVKAADETRARTQKHTEKPRKSAPSPRQTQPAIEKPDPQSTYPIQKSEQPKAQPKQPKRQERPQPQPQPKIQKTPEKQYQVQEQSRPEPEKKKKASSGDTQTHSQQRKPIQQQDKEDLNQPKRPRTVYPKDYRPPVIEPDTSPIHKKDMGGYWRVPESYDHNRYKSYREDARRQFYVVLDWDGQSELDQPMGNEVRGSAVAAEIEKERNMWVQRAREEQNLKDEYDRSISEMTQDYQMKLRDLDSDYNNKKRDIDRERHELEQQISTAHQHLNNRRYGMEGETGMGMLPDYENESRFQRIEPFHMIEPYQTAQPVAMGPYDYEMEMPLMPVATTAMAAPFDFQIRPPIGYQLAHKPDSKKKKNNEETAESMDPLADIKRRERALETEKQEREMELEQDYTDRLAEFEKDFQQKHREIEKDKLEIEKRIVQEEERTIDALMQDRRQKEKDKLEYEERIIQQRQDELDQETADYQRRRKTIPGAEDEVPESDFDDSSDYLDEDSFGDYYANSSEDELLMEEQEGNEEYGDEEFYEEQPPSPPIEKKQRHKAERPNLPTLKSTRRHKHQDRSERRKKTHRNQEGKPSTHRHRHRKNGFAKGDTDGLQIEQALQDANDMSMRAFPSIHPIEYDPTRMAKGIEQSRLESAGLIEHLERPLEQHAKEQKSKEKKIKKKPVPEEKQDDMPQLGLVAAPDLTDPSKFAPRKDPSGIDFEKIAMRRALAQATFKSKEREEKAQWDAEHGGRFSYADEHRSGDKEMLDSKQHAALGAAFHRDREEHDLKELMKPDFDEFKLQFVSPHDQVADDVSQDQIQHADYEERHEQRRLEQLGIDFEDTFDLREKPKIKTEDDLMGELSLQQTTSQSKTKQSRKSPQQKQQKKQQQPKQSERQKKPKQKVKKQETEPISAVQSYIPTIPPARMTMPFQPDTYYSTDIMLDASHETQLKMMAEKQQESQTAPPASADPAKAHFWQGQQHQEHKFSLMDPVHPAKHRTQEQVLDEHFSVDDPHKDIKEGQPDLSHPIPHFRTEPLPMQQEYQPLPMHQEYQPIYDYMPQYAQPYVPTPVAQAQWMQPYPQIRAFGASTVPAYEPYQQQQPAPSVRPMKALPYKPRPTFSSPQASPEIQVTKTLAPKSRGQMSNAIFTIDSSDDEDDSPIIISDHGTGDMGDFDDIEDAISRELGGSLPSWMHLQ